MFMASSLMEVLDTLVTSSGADKSYIEVDVLFSQAYKIDLFINLMFILVIVHAGITALIHIIVAAGHKYGAFLNFVIMIWIGAVMSKLAPWVIKSLLG
jgi:archaellum biogenesis protein FlaJ (TadC family)